MAQLSTLQREDTLSLTALAAEVERRQLSRIDVISDTRKIGFVTDPETAASTVSFDDYPDVDDQRVNDYAHGQIANRLKIPKVYYDRLRSESPELLDTNVRHWLTAQPERRLFRNLDGMLRAVLSDRFRRLDHYDLLGAMLPEFRKIEGLQFHIASLTDQKMYLRAILPSLQAEILGVGDIVQAGVEIKNSEVGSGALVVSPYLWKLDCLNGMVGQSVIRARHTGKQIDDDNVGIYSEETLNLDDAAFFAKVGDLVRASLTEAQFEVIVKQFREIATGEKIKDPIAASEMLTNKLNLTDTEGRSLLANLVEGGDLSQWGAVNAITATAKTADGFDRVAELEEIGGKVAVLTSAEWGRIAVAA